MPAAAQAAAAPAPAPDVGQLDTLPAGANAAGGYRAAGIELLVWGQALYPFDASRQALLARAVNDFIGGVPHSLEISSIGVRILGHSVSALEKAEMCVFFQRRVVW